MANDESVNKLVGLFIFHRTRAPRVDTSLYQAHVAHALSNTLEEVYRLQLVTGHQTTTQVACQFLGILSSGHSHDVASSAEKAPQRMLIDEMPDDDEPNDHAGTGAPMEGLDEDEEVDDHEADPAGVLSAMMMDEKDN